VNKAAIEQKRRERLELVKSMTQSVSKEDGESDGEGGGEESDNPDGKEDEIPTEEDMMKLLGFAGFDSTKVRELRTYVHMYACIYPQIFTGYTLTIPQGKQIDDNLYSAARGTAAKHKGRKYRQYMNRKGGFNRLLQKLP
jgi:U4/U6.U5 tri-snRNP-associated protein 3